MRLRFIASVVWPLVLGSCLRPTPAPVPLDSMATPAPTQTSAAIPSASLDTAAWVDSTFDESARARTVVKTVALRRDQTRAIQRLVTSLRGIAAPEDR